MNTPRKKRRHRLPELKRNKPQGLHVWASGLFNPAYGEQFAAIITMFEHLETQMPSILAVLLGMNDERPAAYVYQALRNPNIRYDVLTALLEKAPNNVNRSEEYDDILSEYNAVRAARNDYAHGLWLTETTTLQVMLARRAEIPHSILFQAELEPLEALVKVADRIYALSQRIRRVTQADLHHSQPPPSERPQSAPPKK